MFSDVTSLVANVHVPLDGRSPLALLVVHRAFMATDVAIDVNASTARTATQSMERAFALLDTTETCKTTNTRIYSYEGY